MNVQDSKMQSQPTMASTDEEDHFDDTDDNASSEGHTRSLNHRHSNECRCFRDSKSKCFCKWKHTCIQAVTFSMSLIFLPCRAHFHPLSCHYLFSCVMKVKWVPWDSENEWGIKSSLCFVEFAVTTSPSRLDVSIDTSEVMEENQVKQYRLEATQTRKRNFLETILLL